MKQFLKLSHILMFAIAATVQLAVTSCNDDEGNGTPVITGVRVCDPEYADSLFSKSAQGQIVAIVGQNLNDATAVYINDQKVSFSTTMNTSHSIIIKVPAETDGFELKAFNSALNEEIRVETTHGTATYPFQVLAASPVITRIQATYPRKAGDVLNIYGSNLVSIDRIYFTDIAASDLAGVSEIGGQQVEISDYDVVVQDHYLDSKTGSYTTTSQLSLIIPELSYDAGSLVIECAAGVRYINYTKRPGAPVIRSISSDMPVIGETLVIGGNDFVQLDSIVMGDVTYKPEEFTVAETEAEIRIPITKVPSYASQGGITIVTPGGKATVDEFFQYETLLNDFTYDAEQPLSVNLGWGPDAVYMTGDESGIGGTGTVAHFDSYGQWWGQMTFFQRDWSGSGYSLPGSDLIPDDVTSDKVCLAFEVYDNNSSFNNGGAGYQGYFRYSLWTGSNTDAEHPDIVYDNFAWDDYEAGTFTNPDGPTLQDSDGEAHVGQWYRAVVPFSALTTVDGDGAVSGYPYKGLTYKDIREKGLNIVRIMSMTQGTKSGTVNVYIDNVRIICIQ